MFSVYLVSFERYFMLAVRLIPRDCNPPIFHWSNRAKVVKRPTLAIDLAIESYSAVTAYHHRPDWPAPQHPLVSGWANPNYPLNLHTPLD